MRKGVSKMRGLRKCAALLLLVVIFTVMTANAANFSAEEPVQPRYTGVANVITTLGQYRTMRFA